MKWLRANISACRSCAVSPVTTDFFMTSRKTGLYAFHPRSFRSAWGLLPQIRQDPTASAVYQQGYGYIVEQLYNEIGRILGWICLPHNPAGRGNMGRAVPTTWFLNSAASSWSASSTIPRESSVKGFAVLKSCRPKGLMMSVLKTRLRPPSSVSPERPHRYGGASDCAGVRGFWNFSHLTSACTTPTFLSKTSTSATVL